jgi:hypothetical protein
MELKYLVLFVPWAIIAIILVWTLVPSRRQRYYIVVHDPDCDWYFKIDDNGDWDVTLNRGEAWYSRWPHKANAYLEELTFLGESVELQKNVEYGWSNM